jgi:hypothetical protein
MEADAVQRSFRLIGGWRLEGFWPEFSFEGLGKSQIVAGLLWFLAWSMILCAGATRVALWVPLNYLLLDIYLVARGGFREDCWERSSRAARALLSVSRW